MKKPFDVKSWTCLSFELAVVLQGLCPKLTSGAIPKREQVLNRCVLNKELLPGTPQKDRSSSDYTREAEKWTTGCHLFLQGPGRP